MDDPSKCTVRGLKGTVFELSETISEEDADRNWDAVLVFSVYGPAPGHERLAEARIKVTHQWTLPPFARARGQTLVKVLSVADLADGSGDEDWEGTHGVRPVRTGRMRAPERGADLLSHERPRRRNVAEQIEVCLYLAEDRHGPWPKPEGERR